MDQPRTHFSDAELCALKRTLQRREATGYRFTEEDLTALEDEHGIAPQRAKRWAWDVSNLHWTPAAKAHFFSGTQVLG